MPDRIQRRRGVALPPGSKSVARPSRWGNPYVWHPGLLRPGRFLVADRAEAIARFTDDLRARDDLDTFLAPLRGHDLACYCLPGEPCHADVLLAALADLDAGQ